MEKRFLTQRFAASAERSADEGLRALREALCLSAVRVARVERERVVHDDNLALDAGWAPEV
jgi:hypothetical protein